MTDIERLAELIRNFFYGVNRRGSSPSYWPDEVAEWLVECGVTVQEDGATWEQRYEGLTAAYEEVVEQLKQERDAAVRRFAEWLSARQAYGFQEEAERYIATRGGDTDGAQAE